MPTVLDSEENKKLDLMVDQVAELAISVKGLIDKMPPAGQTQTVIHKQQGMGAWGAAAVTACFLTYLSLIIFALWSVFQINNLWAWKDIHAGKITRLESQQETRK
jgi:hypothetical protein